MNKLDTPAGYAARVSQLSASLTGTAAGAVIDSLIKKLVPGTSRLKEKNIIIISIPNMLPFPLFSP